MDRHDEKGTRQAQAGEENEKETDEAGEHFKASRRERYAPQVCEAKTESVDARSYWDVAAGSLYYQTLGEACGFVLPRRL